MVKIRRIWRSVTAAAHLRPIATAFTFSPYKCQHTQKYDFLPYLVTFPLYRVQLECPVGVRRPRLKLFVKNGAGSDLALARLALFARKHSALKTPEKMNEMCYFFLFLTWSLSAPIVNP